MYRKFSNGRLDSYTPQVENNITKHHGLVPAAPLESACPHQLHLAIYNLGLQVSLTADDNETL